jgi:hypothetical protein
MKSLTFEWIGVLMILLSCGETIAASPSGGLVIYQDLPSTYVEALEFVTINATSVTFTTVDLPSGKKQEIPRAGIIAVLDYPPVPPTDAVPQEAETTFRSIQKVRPKYPQFTAKLDAIQAKWTNSLDVYRQRQRTAKASPTPTSKALTLKVDGIVYEQVVLTSFNGATVGIEHSAGVADFRAIKLTPEQIAALNRTSSTVQIDPTKIVAASTTPVPVATPSPVTPQPATTNTAKADVVSELGTRKGHLDDQLADKDEVMDAQHRNRVDLMRSPTMKKAQALAAIVANMSDSQAAGVNIAGYGSLGALIKSGRFQNLLESGDAQALEAFLNAANKAGDQFLPSGALDRRARFLSDYDRQDAARVADFDRVGEFNGANLRKRMAQTIAGKSNPNTIRKMGDIAGIQKFLGEFSSFAEVGNREAVMDQLASSPLNPTERDLFAAQFASEARDLTNNTRFLSQFGFESQIDANVAFADSSRIGIAEHARGRQK